MNANFAFTGFGQCPADSSVLNGVYVQFDGAGGACLADAGCNNNNTYTYYSVSGSCEHRGNTSSLGAGRSFPPKAPPTVTLMNDPATAQQTHFRYEVIHEFGHALGFAHEMQRPDNWRSDGGWTQCGRPNGSPDYRNYAAQEGGLYLTSAYDPNSIMNYAGGGLTTGPGCNPKGYVQNLSTGDVTGVSATSAYSTPSFFDSGPRWRSGWCSAAGEVFGQANLNNDAFVDLYCRDPGGGNIWVSLSNGVNAFSAEPTQWLNGWCTGSNVQFGTGDFDANGRTDIWCHDNGNTFVALSTGGGFVNGNNGSNWLSGWCSPGSVFGTADFDGVNGTDAWCREPWSGTLYVALSDGAGRFVYSGSPWLTGWCTQSGASFGTSDFSGDHKADIFCRDASLGNTFVALSTGGGFVNGGSNGLWMGSWCVGSSAPYGQADFNGDNKSDLWCRDPSSGNLWVALTNAQGNAVVAGGGTSFLSGWCTMTGATFGTADFNGDGLSDIWCHDPIQVGSAGNTYVALSTGGGSALYGAFIGGGIWKSGWCSATGATFGTSDFDGNGRADLWCHDPMQVGSAGQTWVALGQAGRFGSLK